MKQFHFTFANQFLPALKELQETYRFSISKDGIPVTVIQRDSSELAVSFHSDSATIVYKENIHFFRGFGLLLEHLENGEQDFEYSETPQFSMNGAMFDVSQGNAVITVETLKSIIRSMAVMGLNMLMVYCEDSFEVKNQPYFGYMRSKYSQEELKELDTYASLFGIEMIPCVQTLAHLTDTLRWECFRDIKEDSSTLLVGEEKTYAFIRDILKSASAPFQTKRIHIGMDEAWRLGLGTYLEKHGIVPPYKIMKEHLLKVMEIVRELGLKPMMWGDMFFRTAGKDYYDLSNVITEEVIQSVPKDMQVIYWDYYHETQDYYETMLQRHKLLGETIFAGGVWSWSSFGANYGKTITTTNLGLSAAKKMGIKQVFATIWGDNGTECNPLATMAGLSLFAEHGYREKVDMKEVKQRFHFCTGGNFDDFVNLKYFDEVPNCKENNPDEYNTSKILMWQDLLTGLYDKNIEGLPLDSHYKKLAREMGNASARNGRFNQLFQFNASVADVLSIKSELGLKLTRAYLEKNTALLEQLKEATLPELFTKVVNLRKLHRALWMSTCKPIGFDIIDMRYGALLARITSAKETLSDYLNGTIDKIEELEQERLPYSGSSEEGIYNNCYGDIVSASRIAPRA